MDLCNIKNLSSMRWIEEKNPYLAFRLLGLKEKRFHFPLIAINISEDVDVIFIEGVQRVFGSIQDFLEKGGRVVFVEKNIERVLAFFSVRDFIPHENIEIILDEEVEYQKIAKSYTFKKQQFIGKLARFRKFLDEFHLAISEYQDFGKTIIRNIQSNLSHTKSFINGRHLEGVYKGGAVILCGSGPTLEDNREKIRALQDEALIFGVGSAIAKLLDWGIRVDGGIFIDPWPPVELYEKIKEVSFPLFYQNRMSDALFKMHKGPKVWMGFSQGWEIEKWIYEKIGLDLFDFDAGWNAGTFALHLAYFLGYDSITLFGMDGGEKRDLLWGKNWIEEFIKAHPDRIYNRCAGKKIDFFCEANETLDQTKVMQVVLQLNEKFLDEKITQFLQKGKHPILLEADLEGEPLYEHLIEPLWSIWKSFYLIENEDHFRQKMVFAKKVLEFQQTFRFYPSGNLYAKETKDGLAELFYEGGEKKAALFFTKGVLNGEFSLYGKKGEFIRKGRYKEGKKEGVHKIYNEHGDEIVHAEFKEGLPINEYIRKNDQGIVIEKLFYHNDKQFDRWLYSEKGELRCEGLFVKDAYEEKWFENGSLVSIRKALWREGKLVWI
ncbi:MAG: DUF115 domain-containing protein [Chlamydiae bacterium]|nr:DUF115 domain-containing protein [Chlamydiota bacterium]